MSEGRYTEADLREAFKAGWKERNSSPGLKRVSRGNLASALGGPRYADVSYVKDDRAYHNGIWLRSAFKRGLGDA